MQLWLYLHFPRLQLESLFSEHCDQPMAIVDEKTHCIVQMNASAKEQGLQLAMGLGSSAALCSDLKVHPYDKLTETTALESIAQHLYLTTADMMLMPPNGLLLKVTDMLTLYQGLDNYWQAVRSSLALFNITYHFSTGFSPLSAQLLAQSATDQLMYEKSSMLYSLKCQPISSADISSAHLELLQRLGVKTIGDLLAIPLADIAQRFNIDLINYIGRLTGQFKHLIDFYSPPEHFESHLEMLFDIENVQWLEKPLEKLLHRLEQFLKPRSLVAYELKLSLHLRDAEHHELAFTSACGESQASQWLTLCQLSLESLTLTHPIQGLTLCATRTGEKQTNNADLFSKRQGQQDELALISYLQAKLGPDRVKKLGLSGDPRPEHATHFYSPMSLTTPKRLAAKHDSIRCLRPSFLLPAPQKIKESIQIIQGPERIVTGWWDGSNIARDYFIARNHSGQWLWVFRTKNQQWYVHGHFS
ncbi:DNA polymerase Y family protein [Vibrio sp. S4M6]|uniref:Y-family DNA polymerase n=1 Tax=Vibrio sinus TaxID=2946865 RepID=UPI002029F3CA|nr:DNA polymerase Y family protein [Vibrio sinus]MCL9783608.1 DNA polymerase Y family protein [Vibrio sinus]